MKRSLARFVKKWRMEFAVVTVLLYLVAVPFTFLVFPDSNIWIALLILFSGLTGSLATLADLLVSAEDADV